MTTFAIGFIAGIGFSFLWWCWNDAQLTRFEESEDGNG
jgi:hypothetical protein